MQRSDRPSWYDSARIMSIQPQLDTSKVHPAQVQAQSGPIQMVSGTPTSCQSFAVPQITVETNSKPRLRFYKALLGLAIIQLVLAGIAVILSLTAFFMELLDGLAYYSDYGIDFYGLWLGALYIVASSCGIGSLRISSGYHCLLVSYFVLLVISIVLTPILIAMSSIWIQVSPNAYDGCPNDYDYNCYYVNLTADLALNSVLLIVGIVLMAVSTISAAFLCCNWHCGQCCTICCGLKTIQNTDIE